MACSGFSDMGVFGSPPITVEMAWNNITMQSNKFVTVTATPEPRHECKVIQRMSEAYRKLRNEGEI